MKFTYAFSDFFFHHTRLKLHLQHSILLLQLLLQEPIKLLLKNANLFNWRRKGCATSDIYRGQEVSDRGCSRGR